MNIFLKNTIIFLIISISFVGCAVKTEPPFPQQEYNEHIVQGDTWFAKMHLYGWRKAEESYARAYEMKKTPELRNKRFLTLCLTTMREKDEQIVNPLVYDKIDQLGDFEKNQTQQYLFDIIQHYRSVLVVRSGDPRLRSKEKKEIDITLFDIENSSLDAYLYLYFLNYYSFDFTLYNEKLVELFKKHKLLLFAKKHTDSPSPLFIYSNFKNVRTREEEIKTKSPQFAEFFVLKGSSLFRDEKLKKASLYFRKALELIPDYTVALNGIGNIYYFTVKNYEKAIEYYEKTLEIDTLNPVALFGKGVSLHFLKRYKESDRVLDFMLEKQSKHHGEAYFYKAYNRYMANEPGKARPLIDKSKSLLPHSGEVHFLSGLLYFNEGKMQEADKDFDKAIWDREYSNCFPLYYLGMIRLKAGDWAFLREFSDSIGCLEARMIMIENRVKEVETMELGEREKEWMRQDRRKKLEEFKKSSQQLIQQMSAIIEKNRDKKKTFDEQVKNKALSRVKTVLERDPGQLNKLDKEGSTLLHKAIENGQQAVAAFLVARGARLDIANSIGYKPLHWAVMIGQKEIIELLIRKGAKVDAAARDGMTPLHDAAHGGNREIIRLLLAAGADSYARTFKGKTPLDLAVEQRKHEVFELLKPIHTAAEKGDIAKVEVMLQKRPGLIDAGDEDNKTPLSLAAANGHKELAWFLVNNGADINARDIDGYTPLMRAQQKNYQKITRMLLVKGAHITDEEILKKQLQEKEAVVWHLNGHSWAVKTKNRFLIFDYSTMHQYRHRHRRPSKPLLSNGHINPLQIRDQQVYVFVSNKLVNHRDPDLVLGWEKTIPGIKYIFGWPALADPSYTIMEGRQKKEINGMEIVTIKATGDGVGFLVKVDGLAIFYPGDHRYFGEDRWEAFTQEIDYLAQKGTAFDIAFLPLAGEDYPGKDNMKKGTGYILEKLQPKVTFLLPFGMGELPVKEFAGELGKKGIETIIHAANSRGDRFVIDN